MSDPFVTVIVVNYNSGRRLAKCLAHLARQSFDGFETIVVDNASTDGSETAARDDANAQLIKADVNLGFAAANNLAARGAKGAWLAFLNPDAYADEAWLAEFCNAVRKYPGVDAFGSAQYDADDPSRIDGAGDVCHGFGLYYRGHFGWRADKFPQDGECFSPCAAAAFYRRRIFEDLGGFDERFFCYGEDVDLGFRLRLAGGRAVQLKNAKVLHEGSGVVGRESDFSLYYGVRNRLWVYQKNIPSSVLYLLAPIHAAMNLAMLARSMAAGRGAVHWRGLRDGMAGAAQRRKERRASVDARKLSTPAMMRLLTWSPWKLARRGADIRPIG